MAKKYISFLSCVFIIVFNVFATYGLGFIGWDYLVPKYLQYGWVLLPLLLSLINMSKVISYHGVWSRMIPYLILMPTLACFSKAIILNEAPFNIMYPVYLSLTFFMFYVYHSYDVTESTIIRGFLIFGMVTFCIQVYQQISGVVYFNLFMRFFSNEDIRNDLARYQVGCPYIQLFCFFYSWYKLMEKITGKWMLLSLFFAVSLYLYLTRQIIVITIITLFCSFIFNKRKGSRKVPFFVLLAILLVGLSKYWDFLFGSMIEQTKNDEGFYIRFVSIGFFFKETFSNIIGMLLGFGQSFYEERWYGKGIYASDAGVFGDMFHYGVTWAITYFITVYIILKKAKVSVPYYLKWFTIATLINCIFSLPYHSYDQAFVWVSILYIYSLYSNKKALIRN